MKKFLALRKIRILILLVIGILPFAGRAEVIDRIVAIVGDEVITESELDEATLLLPNVNRAEILDQLIERELLLVEAKKETLTVEPEELENAIEKAIIDVKSRFPTDEDYELELDRAGITEDDLRNKYRREIERQMLVEKLKYKKFGKESAVSDIEVIDFYNTHLDSIPPRPDAIKLLGIVVYYKVSDEGRAQAKKRAENILDSIKMGKSSFADIAKKYSDDPITRERGGKLGSLNIQDLGKEFQPIVGTMTAGEVAIVPTFDAFHIVKCNERHGEMMSLSSIVVKISPTSADSQATREIADSVAKKLEKGEKSEFPLSEIFSWGEDFIPLYNTPFETLESIEINKVYTFNTLNGVQVIKPIEKSPKHIPTFEEIRDELKALLSQRKLQERYKKLTNKLKQEVFVKKML